MKLSLKQIGLIAGPIAFILCKVFVHPEGMSPEANAILASTLWVAIWWITEAIPIAATSLLPIILFPLSGGLGLQETTASFGHRYIFLYIGGFMLAVAIERWDLHKRIALNIIRLIGTNITSIILGFMAATAFLSMWISNTATSVMMLPIGMAIIAQLRDNPDTIEDENKLFGKALMLGIAYSASIGGIATLVGTPPNLVLAGIIQEFYQIEISFTQWFKFGLPISLVLLAICWVYLTRVAFRFEQKGFPGGKAEINRQVAALGPMSYEEKSVLVVFAFTAIAWITRSYLIKPWLPALDDTIIAMIAAIVLFFIPAKERQGAILHWEEAVKIPWGVLLLFGGGLALAAGFQSSGLAVFIANQMTLLEGIPVLLLILILVAAVNFLTEVTSNLATTSMLLPILAPIALTMGVHPYALMVAATVAASCAFMLPVATPPNAVVFGSGYLRIPDMARTGLWMNLISIFLITVCSYVFLPLVWNIDLFSFPAEFQTTKTEQDMLGLRTTIYQVGELDAAKKWYAEAFETEPYFDEPYYVGFNIGGYELGLQPESEPLSDKSANVLTYWGVENIQESYERLIKMGATEHEAPNSVGGELRVATVKDPWGNVIGIIYNPYFKLAE